MLISLGDAPIHAYQCVQKMKLIFLETIYFSGMVCPVRALAPAKSTIAPLRLMSHISLSVCRQNSVCKRFYIETCTFAYADSVRYPLTYIPLES